jgi:hypothetical protein
MATYLVLTPDKKNKRLHPESKTHVIEGFVGSQVGARDLFYWRGCKKEDKQYYYGLELYPNYPIGRNQHCKEHKKVKITIEISDESV